MLIMMMTKNFSEATIHSDLLNCFTTAFIAEEKVNYFLKLMIWNETFSFIVIYSSK